MKRVGFIVTAWHNGRPSKTGAGYGLKVSVTDQDRFFDKSWESVMLRLTAADSGRIVEVNVAKRSFRDGTCQELISKDIGSGFFAINSRHGRRVIHHDFSLLQSGNGSSRSSCSAKESMMLRFIVHAALLFVLLGICNTLSAQEKPNTLSIEKERQKALEEFDVTEVPDLDAIRLFASELLSTPIEEQEKAQLKKSAKEANRVANLVNYIYDEYDDYYRDSYKYDFIQEKVILLIPDIHPAMRRR